MSAVGNTERVAYTIDEAAHVLGIGTSTVYRLVHSGELPSVRIGGRLLVPVKPLERLLDGDQETADG